MRGLRRAGRIGSAGRNGDGDGAGITGGLRARRWDAVVVGGALPGLAAAVRLGMAGLRVMLVEEESAALSDEAAPGLREPFSLTGGRAGGVVHEALKRLGVPLIERRSLITEDLAHQVLLPGARVDVGVPELCADEFVAWGLAKPDEAEGWLRQLGEVGQAGHEALAGLTLLRRGGRGARSSRGLGGPSRLPALETQPPSGLALLCRAQLSALSNLASASPPSEAAARLLASVLEGGAWFEPPGRDLRGALRRRFASLHGEVRRLSGPFRWTEVGGHPGLARPGGEVWLGRVVLGNAPRSRVAAAFADWGHSPPVWLTGPASPTPTARRAALEYEIAAEALPEALARRALLVSADPEEPPVELVQAAAGAESRRLIARLRVADSDAAVAGARARIEARLEGLLPFSAARLRLRAEAPRPTWDDELALVDPAPGSEAMGELETRVGGRGARGIHWLDRDRVAALGVEGDLLLGVQAGEALAAELV